MEKYSEKFVNLKKEDQEKLLRKLKTSNVEVTIDGKIKTLIQPQQIVSYNVDMRSPSFEKQVLDFIKEQRAWNKRQEETNERNNLLFEKIDKRLDAIEDTLKRNNIK